VGADAVAQPVQRGLRDAGGTAELLEAMRQQVGASMG
jgi:hypothetical protein